MPSRRTVLAGLAAAATAGIAGCLSGSPAPSYATRLPAPATLAPGRYGYASIDVPALREARDRLPDSLRDALDRADRETDAVSLADVRRLTALAAGNHERGNAAGVVVADGRFDVPAIRRELAVDDQGGFSDDGALAGYDRYSYAPRFLEDLTRFEGPDQATPPSGSVALAASEDRLVAGGTLAPERTALDAVDATIAGDSGEALTDSRDVTDVLATVGDRPLVVGGSEAVVARFRDETEGVVREVLDATRAMGAGYELETETLGVALVVDATEALSPDTVTEAVEEIQERDDTPDTDREVAVSLHRNGRVVLVEMPVPLSDLSVPAMAR